MLEEQENDYQKRVEDGLPIKLVYLKEVTVVIDLKEEKQKL